MAKPALFGLLACSLAWAWFNRGPVVDAYQDPSSPVELQLEGIDLTVETTPLPPSPFNRLTADDTRRVPPALAYIEPVVDQAVTMDGGSATISGTVFGVGLRVGDRSAASNTGPPPETTSTTSPTGSSAVPPGPDGTGSSADPAIPPSADPRSGTRSIAPSGPEPEGAPLEGAIVRLERHTTNGIGVRDLEVDERGGWGADDLPGGRYRIRAWIPGLATSGEPEVFFLADEEVSTHRIELTPIDPTPGLELVDGGPMYVGLESWVGVVVSRRWVDEEGLVVTGPVSGAAVSLAVSGPVTIESPTPATTDERGLARFRVRCTRAGATAGTASMGAITVAGPFPTCRQVPPPTPATIDGSGGAGGIPVDQPGGAPPPTLTPTTTGAPGGGGAGGDG